MENAPKALAPELEGLLAALEAHLEVALREASEAMADPAIRDPLSVSPEALAVAWQRAGRTQGRAQALEEAAQLLVALLRQRRAGTEPPR